jgi:transcriptional regulator GlxA family with amidase domain
MQGGNLMRFAVLVYEGVEPIDLGTYGVLSMARRVAPQISVFLVAPEPGKVELASGLSVIAEYGISDCPDADVLIICGGPGWPAQAANDQMLKFIQKFATNSAVAAVCTGGMILAATGLLDGCKATTKQQVTAGEDSPLQVMKQRYPDIETIDARLVDEGRLITAGGVTLGIDATFYLLERFLGEAVANETARIMEYGHAWRANRAAYREFIRKEKVNTSGFTQASPRR